MRRLIMLLLLLPVWAYGGCQSKQEPDSPRVAAVTALKPKTVAAKAPFQRNFNNTASMTAFYKRIEMQADENPEVCKASDFISNPFLSVAEPVLRHYTAQVRTSFKVHKDPMVNLHNARYIDTIFQVNFDSSTVELYYPQYTKRFLLSYADVKSPNLALSNGIKVGTSRQDLLQKLQGYKLFIKEQKNVVEVCDWERNSWLKFHLSKDKVASFEYEGYID